jgi:glycerol-3-phosphate O-acyltransferase
MHFEIARLRQRQRKSDVKPTQRPICTFSAALAALMLALVLLADTSEALTRQQLQGEIQIFHSFLSQRPKVSTELQANPALAGNRKYLDKHDDLKKFFKQHPAVQHEVINHPRNVFASDRRR